MNNNLFDTYIKRWGKWQDMGHKELNMSLEAFEIFNDYMSYVYDTIVSLISMKIITPDKADDVIPRMIKDELNKIKIED